MDCLSLLCPSRALYKAGKACRAWTHRECAMSTRQGRKLLYRRALGTDQGLPSQGGKYLGNLMHWVVQGSTASRAGMRQPTVLLHQVLNSRQLLLRLSPRTLPIPDPTPHKLLNPIHLHLTVLHAVASIRQVLCIGTLATVQVVDKRRADAVVAIKVGGLAGGWR